MSRAKKMNTSKYLHVAPAPMAKTVPTSDPQVSASLKVEVMRVGPELAKKWLEHNHPANRPISWPLVEALSNDIRSGAWKLTHQGIAFDGQGLLTDGQHRLNAIVQAGVEIDILVAHNAAGSMHDPVDRGRGRSVAFIMGKQAGDIAALSTLRSLELGFDQHTPLTLAEAEAIWSRHHEAIEILAKVPYRRRLRGAGLAACIWALPCGEGQVIDFATKVCTGEMISKGDPAFSFRAWQERNGNSKASSGWPLAMAALNCLRHHITESRLSSVYTGEMGYRAVVARRRALRTPNTPAPEIVPGVGWTP